MFSLFDTVLPHAATCDLLAFGWAITPLLAQEGAAKTALGFALTGLLVGAGLILVARPSHRLTIEERQKQNRRRKE
jgi:hypothetical protein